MNSLYGRFGMHPHRNNVVITNRDDALLLATAFPIIRTIPFSNQMELIEYYPVPKFEALEFGLVDTALISKFIKDSPKYSETNVPIAAAVTANSRMIINQYKLYCVNHGIDIYYSDTDSLVVNSQLPAHLTLN